jgi:hypothetical protein
MAIGGVGRGQSKNAALPKAAGNSAPATSGRQRATRPAESLCVVVPRALIERYLRSRSIVYLLQTSAIPFGQAPEPPRGVREWSHRRSL